MLPDDIVREYYKQVKGAQESPLIGGYVFPCSAELPSFTVTIGGGGSSNSDGLGGGSNDGGSSSGGSGGGGFGDGFGDGLGGGLGGGLGDGLGDGLGGGLGGGGFGGFGNGFSTRSTRSTRSSGSGTYKAVTPGKYIKLAPVQDGGKTCFGGIQSNQGMEFAIFGDVFLKNQYVVFDPEGPKLGFAPQADPS